MPTSPTGQTFTLDAEGVHAEINEVGASLRALTVGGVDLVPRYPHDIPTPSASGVILVPWPNRIRGGRWTQQGVTRQLAISEPAFGNASHGLLRFAPYTVAEQEADRITVAATVFPQTGYPFHLDTRVTYLAHRHGIVVRHEIRNVGADAAPVAVGAHPFVQIGTAATADLVLQSTGTTTLVVDDVKIPVGDAPVDASTDLRDGRRLGDLSLDTAYHHLARDADGRARHTLTAPDGATLTLWQGPGFEWAQVFTTDKYPGHDLAVAIEPMTAPPDAFNSGTDIRWLAPAESWSLEWGIETSGL